MLEAIHQKSFVRWIINDVPTKHEHWTAPFPWFGRIVRVANIVAWGVKRDANYTGRTSALHRAAIGQVTSNCTLKCIVAGFCLIEVAATSCFLFVGFEKKSFFTSAPVFPLHMD
jgi:hypothetical protein